MKRYDNLYLSRGIFITSVSSELTNSKYTHTWTVSISSAFNVSMDYIDEVEFILHDTFAKPVQRVKYPFEVTECGWGEFTIYAKIHFVDENEKPITLSHFIKLYEENTGTSDIPKNPNDKKVIHRVYNEIIFRSPTKKIYDILKKEVENRKELLGKMKKEEKKIDEAIEYVLNEYF